MSDEEYEKYKEERNYSSLFNKLKTNTKMEKVANSYYMI